MTPDEINSLPEKVRRYIHALEAEADPAGNIRQIHVLREQVAALTALLDMKWSKTVPTEPGYYWWREGANGTPAIIKLSRRRSGALLRAEVIGSERVTELLPVSTWVQGEWMGPLSPEE